MTNTTMDTSRLLSTPTSPREESTHSTTTTKRSPQLDPLDEQVLSLVASSPLVIGSSDLLVVQPESDFSDAESDYFDSCSPFSSQRTSPIHRHPSSVASSVIRAEESKESKESGSMEDQPEEFESLARSSSEDQLVLLRKETTQPPSSPTSPALSAVVEYSFAWSVATQKGYRYTAPNGSQKMDIHREMEDMHYPSHSESPNHTHRITGRPFQLFMLADGHGGHACAQFAVKRIPPAVVQIVHSRAWDLSLIEDRRALTQEIQHLFLKLDDEYCRSQLETFRQWSHQMRQRNIDPNSQQARSSKPQDDGCTLVVNLLYDGYLVNCNVGDSRTVLLQRSEVSSADWKTVFSSTDHTPGHPVKAFHIHSNGGRYMYNGMTADVGSVVLGFNATEWSGIIDPHEHVYERLSQCRIARAAGWRIQEIDVAASTTLNLTATMGDLFFKYHPALITARPDVSFFPLAPQLLQPAGDQGKFLLVMASDGLWDHMQHHIPQEQHDLLAAFVQRTLDEPTAVSSFPGGLEDSLGFMMTPLVNPKKQQQQETAGLKSSEHNDEDDEESAVALEEDMSQEMQFKLRQLGVLAHGLCDREMTTSQSGLFARGVLRYDDVTAFVVLIEGGSQ